MLESITKYKDTPIGKIPMDWEVRKFKECAKFYSGGTPITSKKEYYGGNVPFIKSGEIYNNITGQFLTKEGLDNSSAKMVQKGDLLYALYGANSGEVAISKINGAINQAILCIKPEAEFSETNYLSNFLILEKSNIVQKYLQGGQGNLSADIIKNLFVPLPPLPEQKKIAEVLSTWDKAIQETSSIIKRLEKRNKALAFSLMTGKKRVQDFNKIPFKKSLANEIFKNTSVKNNDHSLELLSATQEYGIIPRRFLETRVTMPTGSVSSYKLVEKGDFVISLRSFQGGIEYSEYNGIVSPAYTVLKALKPINEDFYQYYFKSIDLIGRLSVAVIGIRDGKNISYDDFSKISLPNPSLEEQTKIGEILNTGNKELQQYQQKLNNLKSQKKGLMQQLLTGKVRTV